MNIRELCVTIIFLTWSFSPIILYYSSINSINQCKQIYEKKEEKLIDFKLTLTFSVYSNLFFSILAIADIVKKINNYYINSIISVLGTINIITGGILIFSLIIPESPLYDCPKEILIIIGLSSIISEILILVLLSFSLFGAILVIHGIFVLFKDYLIFPFLRFDIKKICIFGLFTWTVLLLWNLIENSNDVFVVSIGVFQIFLSMLSIIIFKLYFDKFKYCFNIVIALSITIYFIEIFNSKYGLTPYGIISFSSIGFYPAYFVMRKCRKIYKNYVANKLLMPQKMPTEPPAICASGEYEI